LQDLLQGGYLTTNDVRAFEGMDVIFSTQADVTRPQMILARARMPDGQFICLLADGSVQQFTAARLKEALGNSGQPGDAPNRSRPVRQETNQPSPAAGSDPVYVRQPSERGESNRNPVGGNAGARVCCCFVRSTKYPGYASREKATPSISTSSSGRQTSATTYTTGTGPKRLKHTERTASKSSGRFT